MSANSKPTDPSMAGAYSPDTIEYRKRVAKSREKKDWVELFSAAQVGRSKGDLCCAAWTAYCYETGLGTEPNLVLAYEIAQKLMAQKFLDGFMLASRLAVRLSRPMEEVLVIQKGLVELGESGAHEAYCYLGRMYAALGKVEQAVEFYTTGVDKKDPCCCLELALMFRSGKEKDQRKVKQLMKLAAELGSIEAMYELGASLWKAGSRKAKHWLTSAAHNGHVDANLLLGVYWLQRKNFPQSIKYFNIAKAGGSIDAKEALDELANIGYEV